MLRTTIRPALTLAFHPLSPSCPTTRRAESSLVARRSSAWSPEAPTPSNSHTVTATADQRPSPHTGSPSPTVCSSHDPPADGSEVPRDKAVGLQSGPGLDTIKNRMREWAVVVATTTRRHADAFSVRAGKEFSQLAGHLNRATGYDAIDVLKRQVVEQEARIKAARQAAKAAKAVYDEAVVHRAAAQRDVNELLQRKSTWSDEDVVRFTALVRADHAREQEEVRAKAAVAASEDTVEREFSALMRTILARYHEEQVWSDKIRSISTYGSLAVLGVNVMVFVVAIVFVEPWKRKRLALTFERKVEELGAETKMLVDEGMTRLQEHLANHERLLADLTHPAPTEIPLVPEFPAPGRAVEEPQLAATQVQVNPWVIGPREVMLIAGSAIVGGAISLLTHSLFSG